MKKSNSWLTSFGDLLTLLLCFFVVSIYSAGKIARQKEQSDQRVSAPVHVQNEDLAASGKEIASKIVTEIPHLALGSTKFEPGYARLTTEGFQDLQSFSESTEGKIELGVCNVGFDYSETVFEKLENQLAPREVNFSIGQKVCNALELLKSDELNDVILVTAKLKQSHG